MSPHSTRCLIDRSVVKMAGLGNIQDRKVKHQDSDDEDGPNGGGGAGAAAGGRGGRGSFGGGEGGVGGRRRGVTIDDLPPPTDRHELFMQVRAKSGWCFCVESAIAGAQKLAGAVCGLPAHAPAGLCCCGAVARESWPALHASQWCHGASFAFREEAAGVGC